MKKIQLEQISSLHSELRTTECTISDCKNYLAHLENLPDHGIWFNGFHVRGNGMIKDINLPGTFIDIVQVRKIVEHILDRAEQNLNRLNLIIEQL